MEREREDEKVGNGYIIKLRTNCFDHQEEQMCKSPQKGKSKVCARM